MGCDYSTLTALFTDIVKKYPDRPAIRDCEKQYTYRELYQYSRRVAAGLQLQGIGPDDRVICVSGKDVDSIVCFWGILTCGGIPVMLDQEEGSGSNAIKIREVEAKAIIVREDRQSDYIGFDPCVLLGFEALLQSGVPLPECIIGDPVSSSATCYILLTSGTTGKPKAVQISHENVLHYVCSIYKKIGSPAMVNAVHASTFAADLGLTNLLVALISGGLLRILNKTESTDPAIFNRIIDQDEISLVKITPSHLLSLMAVLSGPYKKPVHTIILGGEKLSWETVKTIFSSAICTNLYNHYGPTETTVGAIAYNIREFPEHIDKTASVPLGMPLGKGNCFINNPVDDTGELCITGPGVSIGYFKNKEENDKKFFMQEVMGEAVRCYRTGDICRKLGDGNYEFLYRTDRQVKISGYRIELGETELAIAAHDAVESVVVAISAIRDHQVMDAYIRLIKGKELSADMLRDWLAARLPGYKIPSNFYYYTVAPYNSNGKMDLSLLKESFKKNREAEALEVTPSARMSWSEQVSSSWKKVLNIAVVLKTDNFYETGGDSLLAIQLIGRLQRYGYKVNITDLNKNPLFEDFILLAPEQVAQDDSGINKGQGLFFTFPQDLFMRRTEFGLDNYCQSLLLETDHKIRVREMAIALNYVLESHHQLTTSFTCGGTYTEPGKREDARMELGVSILDIAKPVIVQIQEVGQGLLNGISIDAGKMIVAHVFVEPGGKDYFYLACHHLVVDVISWNIIIDELLDYYDQALKSEPPVITPENIARQFYDERKQKGGREGLISGLADKKVCRLPGSETIIPGKGVIQVCQIAVPEDISRVLRNADEQEQSLNLSGILLSALGGAVMRALSMQEVTIDMEFHGRPQIEGLPDLSRSVAWWATTMAVTLGVEDADAERCSALVTEMTGLANVINMYPEQFVQMGTLRADIRLNYLGYFPGEFRNGSISMRPSSFNPGPTRSKTANQEYLLYCTARFVDEVLIIDFQYNASFFSRESIEEMMQKFYKELADHGSGDHQGLGVDGPVILQSNIPSVGQPLYNLRVNGVERMSERKTIFITGVTGFLGNYLMQELRSHRHTDIYCLVRGESQMDAESRLRSHFLYYFRDCPVGWDARIKVVRGDLLSEKLGMSAADHEKIANEADLILHAAADVNLLKAYSELSRSNTMATRSVIELAGEGRKKAIHYISTLAVSGYSPEGRQVNFSEADLEYGQFFISDYERTKFESEKMVRQFLDSGGAGRVYRVGHIAADSIQGRFQKNIDQNRVFQVIKGITLLKMAPEAYRENFSFSYVDIVAKGVVASCMGSVGGNMNCMHMENPQVIPFNKIVGMLQLMGYEIAFAGMKTFKEAVADFDGGPNEKRIVELMNSWVQRAMDFPRRMNYVQKDSIELLARIGLYFPKADPEWFSGMINEGIKAGYFQSPSSLRSKFPVLSDAAIF